MMWVLWVVFILSCGVFVPMGLEILYYKLMGDMIFKEDDRHDKYGRVIRRDEDV